MQKIKKKITLYIVELPSAYNPLNQQKKFPSVLGGAAIFRPSGLEEIFSPLGFEKRSECGLSIRFALLFIVLEVWLLWFVLVDCYLGDCFGLVLVFIWFFCEICSGMAEDLTKLWRNFCLSEEESLGVEVVEQGMHEIGSRGKACMVSKLFSDRLIGKDAIRSTPVRAWRPEGTLVFKVLGDNIFLLEFEHFWEKDRVKEGQPWVFEGNLISIADYNGSIPPAQRDFEKVSFWARMFNLPLSCMSAANQQWVIKLESRWALWKMWKQRMTGYLRVKIRLDIAKPLARGRVLKINGSDTWVAFQYEGLPKFCYHCGVIKHGVAGCLSRKGGIYRGDSSTQQFGCFLRVPPYNRSFPGKGGYRRSVYSGDSEKIGDAGVVQIRPREGEHLLPTDPILRFLSSNTFIRWWVVRVLISWGINLNLLGLVSLGQSQIWGLLMCL
jgi:hypothetical protein